MSSTTDQEPTPTPPTDIARVLNEIAAGQLDTGRVADLSDPTRAQLEQFTTSWPGLPVAIKREIVRAMSAQAEENIALNFSRYYRYLIDDPDDEIRALAIRALWEDDAPSLLIKLSDLAMVEESAPVQEVIAVSLGTFSYQVELDELDEELAARTQRALFHLIENGANWMVRRRALESASFMSRNPSVKQYIEATYGSDFEQEIAGALVAMGRNLDERWHPVIMRELTNDDPDIRCEAARAAGEAGYQDAIDPLSRLVDDEDDEIREVSVRAIGQIGGSKAVDTLEYLDTQVDDEMKSIIQEALEEARFLSESMGIEE